MKGGYKTDRKLDSWSENVSKKQFPSLKYQLVGIHHAVKRIISHLPIGSNSFQSNIFTCSVFWVISDDSNGSSVHPCESSDQVLRIQGHHFKEFSLVHDS